MDSYEATKLVFQRIQTLDPENASKIMGFLLIQDHGEKEIIRLAFGPEPLLHSSILKAKKELGLVPSSNSPSSTPSTPSSPSPFSNNPLSLSRQNSCSSASSRILGGVNLPSPLSMTNLHSSSSSWTNSSDFQTPDDLITPTTYNRSSPSTMNSAAAPFYACGRGEVDLIDELQLQDQLSFLNDVSPQLGPKSPDLYCPQQQDLAGNDAVLFSWGGSAAVNGLNHRRSCSVSDICMGSDELSGGFGWKPCLYYAKGFCKNGTSCRFLHGEGAAADGGSMVGSPSKFELMEQCQELIRSKASQQQRLMDSSGFSFAPVPSNKCMNFLLQQQLPADSPRSVMMGDGMHKFSRNRFERGDFGMNGMNPGSRQIYLTFPADSTFKEEDVSNYFSIFGPVQDVRIPYQQKRMFGFVTFDYPETVKLILAKGNPHFVCDARVLVKPYKEKGKIPEKHRRQHQQMERGEFTGCGSPTGIESRDPYDFQLGGRVLYNTQDILWRRKLEEQADLQQAIELQNLRLMGLQLFDVKRNNHHRTLSTSAVASSPSPSPMYSPTFFNHNVGGIVSGDRRSPEAKEENGSFGTMSNPVNMAADPNANVIEEDSKDSFVNNGNCNAKESSPKDSDFQESLEHNLPDSPFASPKAVGDYRTAFSEDTSDTETGGLLRALPSTNTSLMTGSSLFPATSATFKSCYFQVPSFASGHETIGM